MSCFPHAVKAFIFANFVFIPCVYVSVVFTVDLERKLQINQLHDLCLPVLGGNYIDV